MAEEKRPAPAGSSNSITTERIISLLAGLLLLAALASALLAYLDRFGTGTSSLWSRLLAYFFEHIWPVWKIVAVIISALSVVGIVNNIRKLRAIDNEEKKIYDIPPAFPVSDEKEASGSNEKWQRILNLSNSDNSSDWRLAIIEADVMLEELLRATGHLGESVGEMLKSVNKNEFITIEDAWEGHKARNAVAHPGKDFEINQRATKDAIAHFEKVFKEFKVI